VIVVVAQDGDHRNRHLGELLHQAPCLLRVAHSRHVARDEQDVGPFGQVLQLRPDRPSEVGPEVQVPRGRHPNHYSFSTSRLRRAGRRLDGGVVHHLQIGQELADDRGENLSTFLGPDRPGEEHLPEVIVTSTWSSLRRGSAARASLTCSA
jgi:hypothetical protein